MELTFPLGETDNRQMYIQYIKYILYCQVIIEMVPSKGDWVYSFLWSNQGRPFWANDIWTEIQRKWRSNLSPNLGKGLFQQRKHKCKGPEAGVWLACWRRPVWQKGSEKEWVTGDASREVGCGGGGEVAFHGAWRAFFLRLRVIRFWAEEWDALIYLLKESVWLLWKQTLWVCLYNNLGKKWCGALEQVQWGSLWGWAQQVSWIVWMWSLRGQAKDNLRF